MLQSRATTYLLLLLALVPGAAAAQGSLEVIQLRHTTAERVLPALRPLLEPGGVLTGQRSQLIVRTSPGNLEELRRALQVLDAAARRLEILVRFDSAGQEEAASLGADARVSDRGSRVIVRGGASRSVSGERIDQRLQVLEGGRAFIAAGSSRPLQIRDGVVLREAVSGFEVVPRLAGGMAILDISPQRQTPGTSPGSVDSLGASTTVRVPLGAWVELGGIDSAQSRDDRGLAAGAQRSGAGSRRIWVRINEVGP